MVQVYGNKFIHPISDHWLMAPSEDLWNPEIKKPEQCNYCLKWFHQDIGGICSPCYQIMSRLLYDTPVSENGNNQGIREEE